MSAPKTAAGVKAALRKQADPVKAPILRRFFKTGPGEYAEGDQFLGVSVPTQRKIAREFRGISLAETKKLLVSKMHEDRLTGLILLVDSYERGTEAEKREIFKAYLASTKHINNWDLVDTSAAQIVGRYLLDKSRARLRALAKSKSLWERRIAIIATFAFINKGEHRDTFEIARLLMKDEHDLIHKAVGWMLREVGKRVDVKHLRAFLAEHAPSMPRTALRYALEHLPAAERQRFMKQK
ncbi:MAG: DNA alkylation repair protein [Sandaracinaceae bacterium]|nr:DNA alkylation repair protein [Sandaracinaceae bacterium]